VNCDALTLTILNLTHTEPEMKAKADIKINETNTRLENGGMKNTS
jgi:hypothetical protein